MSLGGIGGMAMGRMVTGGIRRDRLRWSEIVDAGIVRRYGNGMICKVATFGTDLSRNLSSWPNCNGFRKVEAEGFEKRARSST